MVCEWRLVYSISNQLIQKRSFKLLHNLSSSQEDFNSKNRKFSPRNVNCRIVLTPRVVELTLLKCSSDVIALSFFLWCAKQPDYFHDRRAFDHMVCVVARLTEQFRTVEGIVRELGRVGCVAKGHVFMHLLRIYWRGGMHGLVFEAFEQMSCHGFTPNTCAHNVIMDVLFRIGRVDAALQVLRQIQVPNFWSFHIAMYNLCKLNDLVNVKYVIRIMLRQGFYPNAGTFEMVLSCFCKRGRIQEAYQVLCLMITLGISTSVTVWSILVDGFCRLGRLGMAEYLLEKMVETGSSPNVVTYTSLIKGFLESKMVGSAYDILSVMQSSGFVFDLVLYNVLIDSLSKIGRYDDALDVYGGLLKQNLVPDSYTFSSLLSTICLSQRFSFLPQLVSELVMEVDLVVCNSLLSYFCKAGYPSLAVEFYSDMLDRGFLPDNYTFVGLLRGLCGARRIGEAINFYCDIVMNHSGLDAHIHTILINELIKAGKFQTAIRLFRLAVVEKYPLDVVSYTVAIQGFLRVGRMGEACALYKQMKEAGILPGVHTYNLVLSGFCKERDVIMVKQMLQEMIAARIELSSNNFFRINKFVNQSHKAHSIFDLLVEMRVLGLMPPHVMHTVLIDELSQGLNVGNEELFLLKDYLGISGSQDLSDAAVSVG